MWFISAVKLLVTRNTFMALFQRKLLRLEVDIIVNLGLEQKNPTGSTSGPARMTVTSPLFHFLPSSLFFKINTFYENIFWIIFLRNDGMIRDPSTTAGRSGSVRNSIPALRIGKNLLCVKNFPDYLPSYGNFFL